MMPATSWSADDTVVSLPERQMDLERTGPPGYSGSAPCTKEDEGHIYVVFASKGGVGSTTVSVNLGAIFARSSRRGAVIVDLNLQLGDVLTALSLETRSSVLDIVEELDHIDSTALRRTLSTHPSGACAVSQSHRLDQIPAVRPEDLGRLLRGLTRHFDAVFVDGLADFGDLSLAALDAATRIVLLVSAYISSVRRAQHCLRIFRQLGYDERLRVVINRHRTRFSIRPELVAQALGAPIFALLPDDIRANERSLQSGMLLIEQSPVPKVARELNQLALRLMTEHRTVGPPPLMTMANTTTARDTFLSRFWKRCTGGEQ
jgi:pilus assembly protein CpaE